VPVASVFASPTHTGTDSAHTAAITAASVAAAVPGTQVHDHDAHGISSHFSPTRVGAEGANGDSPRNSLFLRRRSVDLGYLMASGKFTEHHDAPEHAQPPLAELDVSGGTSSHNEYPQQRTDSAEGSETGDAVYIPQRLSVFPSVESAEGATQEAESLDEGSS
jgi:hypothetical protein